jgi:asparagine synthase (glutamine-hydrolysing)
MPHVAGILDFRPGRQTPQAALRTFERTLAVAGVEYVPRRWSDEHFGCTTLLNVSGCAGPLNQPVTSHDGRYVLFLDGVIYEPEKLALLLEGRATGYDLESVAQLCMALYESHGSSFAPHLNGSFNLVIYDKTRRAVTVINDRLGYRPIYYYCRGGLTLFALERKAILAAWPEPPEVDPLAALELFTFGHHLEDRTLFHGILAAPQASVVRFSEAGVESTRYWEPSYEGIDPRMRLDDAAEELGRRLVRATARRAGVAVKRPAIFLSGGLDSRAVAGALARARGDVASFTFGPDESPDVRFAGQLARRLGFRHRHLKYPPDIYLPALPRVVWRTEGSVPYHSCTSVEQHRHMTAHDVAFNGHFGDALTGGHMMPQQLLTRGVDRLVDHIFLKRSNMRLGDLRGVFSAGFLDRHYPAMRDSVRGAVARFDEDRTPLLYNLWDITVRQRRYTFNSPAVDRYLFEQVTPFTDNDLVDWSLRIPLRYLFGQRAYKRMIVRAFSEIAGVPWARTSRPVPTSFVLDAARQGGDFLARRARRFVAARAKRSVACGGPSQLGDPRLRDRIETYLRSDAALAGAFDAAAVRATLDGHFGGGKPATYAVSNLLTLAEATRLFVTSPVGAVPHEAEPDLGDRPAPGGVAREAAFAESV